MPTALLLLAVGAAVAAVDPTPLKTKVWYTENLADFIYPEASLPSLANKTDAAILFTGGGVRSYTATMGYLAGLRDAGLLDKPRYIGGVSGGSWAVATYNYAQLGAPGVATTDEELLCEVVPPENITLNGLKEIAPTCARLSGTASLSGTILELFLDKSVTDEELWSRAISKIYLEPQGISKDAYFSLEKTTVAAIVATNPSLSTVPFVVQIPGRPYMVLGTTMVGPQGVLLDPKNHSWASQEGTPLYFGQPHLQNVTYLLSNLDKDKSINLSIGGYIESWAMGNTPTHSATHVASGSTVETTASVTPFRLRELTGMSSFVFGGVTSSVLPASVAAKLTPQFANWPRNGESPNGRTMIYADGGLMENLPLIPMLRRRVSRIVAFINAQGSLASSETWNPATQPYDTKFMDDYVPGYFGVVPKGQFGYDTTRDQVFATADFVGVVQGLQASMATGKGAIATTTLTTIVNEWWGVSAGITVNVTWVYLSRETAWEALLPTSVQSEVRPKNDPSNPQNLPKTGPFVNFPHYDDVEQASLTPSQANLMADMTGWTIGANLETFTAALA